MGKEEFIKKINKKRRDAGDKWYEFIGIVEGKRVQLKAHKTWLQVYKVDGVRYGGEMGDSVKQFNKTLKLAL